MDPKSAQNQPAQQPPAQTAQSPAAPQPAVPPSSSNTTQPVQPAQNPQQSAPVSPSPTPAQASQPAATPSSSPTVSSEPSTTALVTLLSKKLLKNKLALGIVGAAFVLFLMGFAMGRASAPSCKAQDKDLDTTIEEPYIEDIQNEPIE